MKFYKLSNHGYDAKAEYFCTRDEAHNRMKLCDSHFRPQAVLELVEIDTDQKTIAMLLSGWGCDEKSLREWNITPRGGLKEIT